MTGSGRGWEMVDDARAEAASPGQWLRAARERAGLSVRALAAELKLPPNRVEDLEADRFDPFGPPVFVRGYLRRYAMVLGLAPEEVLALYEQAGGESRPAGIGLPPGKPPRPDRSGWLNAVLGASAVAAVLAGGWWLFAPPPGGPDRVTDTETPDVEAPLSLEAPVLERPASGPEPSAPATPAREEPPAEALAEIPADEAPQADAPEGDEPLQEAAETVADSLGTQGEADPVAGPAPEFLAGQAEIRIELDEDCWMEIVDAEGRQLAYRLGRAGQVTRVRGTVPISVFLGNAEGVKMTVDGEAVAVRPAARRDGTARLTVGGGAG